jgi:hypothetical protein
MKKNAILLVTFVSIIIMLPGISFAEDDKEVGLDNVIEILQVLAGGKQPPAFNATGTWAVQSVQNGQKRTGEVFLDMAPNGSLKGYAELTSLQGLSSVTGVIHGLSFDLKLSSDYGNMIVHGVASSDGESISGSFFIQENIEVFWDGHRQRTQTYTGTYDHDSENNKLSLTFADGTIMPFDISEFNETKLVLNNAIWTRNIPGEPGDLVGIWRNNQMSDVEQITTFYPDGTFSNIQKLLSR